jgi:serine/threonine-protein kinase HipA
MTALGAIDGEQRDYLEIIDFITRFGSRPKADIAELLRRIRFCAEINNTDDHLRNHGFILEKGGWHLSPLFDVAANADPNALRQTTFMDHADAQGTLRALDEYQLE